MNDFHFNTPGTIIFRTGSSGDTETYKSLIKAGRTLLVTDSTLQKLGIADKVQTALEGSGADVLVYDKVEPEPNAATVRDIAETAKGENVIQVIGLGGGSPMDVAKIASLMIPHPQPIESMYGVGQAEGVRLPLILIPTTAGTGSEGTPVAVVTGDDGEKSPVIGPQFICDSVILDAELTLALPPGVTAATGIDAMVHSIEAYTSGTRKNPVSDQLAIKALKLLHGNIRTAVMQGNNIDARGNMLVGSMMAGLAFANASVGAVHALAYPVGSQFHLSHGESNSVILVPVMRFNLSKAVSLYADLGREIIPECMEVSNMDAAGRLIEEMNRIVPEIGLKDRLSDYGIDEKNLDTLVDGALKQERILSYNIKSIDREDILNVYQSIL
ncbi:MAG: iron-containing alcohol dehydrogenase [Bacteroidetes bacterium]|nr:iron-containing alcohol dehydrogenase [Bacteroidota bacterium]